MKSILSQPVGQKPKIKQNNSLPKKFTFRCLVLFQENIVVLGMLPGCLDEDLIS